MLASVAREILQPCRRRAELWSASVPTYYPTHQPTYFLDRNYFNLGADVTATLKRGASAFFYYETVLGRDNVTNHSFNAGVRFQFE